MSDFCCKTICNVNNFCKNPTTESAGLLSKCLRHVTNDKTIECTSQFSGRSYGSSIPVKPKPRNQSKTCHCLELPDGNGNVVLKKQMLE